MNKFIIALSILFLISLSFATNISHLIIDAKVEDSSKIHVLEKYYIQLSGEQPKKYSSCENDLICLKARSGDKIMNHLCNHPKNVHISYSINENHIYIELYYVCDEIKVDENNVYTISHFNFPSKENYLYHIPSYCILNIELPRFAKIIDYVPKSIEIKGNVISIFGEKYLPDLYIKYKIENPIKKSIVFSLVDSLSNPFLIILVILSYYVLKYSFSWVQRI